MKLEETFHSYDEAVKVVEDLMQKFFVKYFRMDSDDNGVRVIVKYTGKKEEG